MENFSKKSRIKPFVMFFAAFLFVAVGMAAGRFASLVFSFGGPADSPGVGSGAIGVDEKNNLSFGTSTPISSVRVLIVGAGNTSQTYALKVTNESGSSTLVVSNDGVVSLGLSGATVDTSGTFTGLIGASNVSSGVFRAGNYAFPSSLGVATSSTVGLPQPLSVYGNAYISGNVGIGTTAPGTALNVVSANNGVVRIDTSSTGDASTALTVRGTSATGGTAVGVEVRRLNSDNQQVQFRLMNAAYNKGWAWAMPANSNDLRLANIGTGYSLTVLDGSGNVGIGTTAPGTAEKLAVALSSGQGARIGPWGNNGNVALLVSSATTTQTGLIIRGASGQTAALLQVDVAGGTPGLLVNSAGNVGIGTTAPGYKLDVQGGQINASGGLCIAGDCKTSWSGVGSQWTSAAGGIYYAGNVSIGTSTISYPLYVSTSTDSLFVLYRTGAGYPTIFKQGTDGALVVNNSNSDTLTLKSGNVGIGTTAPGEKLEVNGNIKLSGATPTYRITNVADPAGSYDVVNKNYIDNYSGPIIYQSDGTTPIGQFSGIAQAMLYDFVVVGLESGASGLEYARVIYSTRNPSDGRPTNDALIYSGAVDNFCDLSIYLSSSTSQIQHLITGDCSTFQGRASSTWYYSSANCAGTVYVPSTGFFPMTLNGGFEGWGDNYCYSSNNTRNYYKYCLSLNHNQKALWRGGGYQSGTCIGPGGEIYSRTYPSCIYNDSGVNLVTSRSYQSYRLPNGSCVNASGSVYGLIITPTPRVCGSIAVGTGECVVK